MDFKKVIKLDRKNLQIQKNTAENLKIIKNENIQNIDKLYLPFN